MSYYQNSVNENDLGYLNQRFYPYLYLGMHVLSYLLYLKHLESILTNFNHIWMI